MEESVALDTSKQKEFVKSVRGIKKLLKKKNKEEDDTEVIKSPLKSVKRGKNKKRNPRGLVYLSHIPHGFYEHEMTQYFRQFGMVTNVRVIRSKRTGASKGFAFVEFSDPTVGQVVAETMNNYLMGKRLIKAVYIPPEKQRINAKRMKWTAEDNPTANKRRQEKKNYNAPKSEDTDRKAAVNMLKTLKQTKMKLKEMGIDYDFFMPVDIPEGVEYVQDTFEVDVKKEKSKGDKKHVKVSSEDDKKIKESGNKTKDTDVVKVGKKLNTDQKKNSKPSDKFTVQEVTKELKKGKHNVTVTELKQKEVKNSKNKQKLDETQKGKKQKLEDLKVELLEDFINIQESDGDSDGSLEFDSDEFEKAMGEESSESDYSNDESSADEEQAEIVIDRKLQLSKKNSIPNAKNAAKQKPVVAPKRKAEQKAVQPKKVKFEKQNKKTSNKVIKKKK